MSGVRLNILVLLVTLLGAGGAWGQEYLAAEATAPDSLPEIEKTFAVEPPTLGEAVLETGLITPYLVDLLPALEPVVSDTVFVLSPRSYYFYRDRGNGGISETWALGGSLTYESGWWRDFARVGVGAYTSQKLVGPEDRDGAGLLAEGQRPYTTLGESYLQILPVEPLLATFYRQSIELPYINRDDSRMTPALFEGATFVYGLGTELTLIGGHLTDIKPRTTGDFRPMSVQAGADGTDKGVSIAGLKYSFFDDTYLGAVNQYGWDTFNTFYVESESHHALRGGFDLAVRGQFTDQRDVGEALVGDFSTQFGGVKLSLGRDSLIGHLAYTTTTGQTVRSPWGGDPSFNSLMISDFNRTDEDSLRVGMSWQLDRIGLVDWSGFINYAWGNTPDGPSGSPDQEEFNVTLDYRVEDGPLKDFWLRFRVGRNDRDQGGDDRLDFRVIANHTIHF